MRLVLLGAPGSGKGTQAERIVGWLRIAHLSTGHILREAISSGTPIGLSVQAVVESGGLVPDEVVSSIVLERLADPSCQSGYVLDGFPRTIGQAQALDAGLMQMGQELDHVVELVVSPDILIERIVRRADQARAMGIPIRADDNPATFKKRLDAYLAETAPVSDYYRNRGKLRLVDGMQDPDAVAREVLRALGKS